MIVQTPASRKNGPDTSFAAERHINATGIRASQQRRVHALIVSHPGYTTQELAALGVLNRDEISRRAPELLTANLVRKAPMRKCRVTDRLAHPWLPV